jgi:hypothetical protein
MAKLVSEDQESVSSLEIVAGPIRDLQGQKWQQFSLTLESGDYKFILGNIRTGEPNHHCAACVVCRKPLDELAHLIDALQELADFDRDKLMFEPAEPSFELIVTRAGITGVKVSVWIDAGNAKTGVYRWDSAGIRFYTTQANLCDFLKELKQEFSW